MSTVILKFGGSSLADNIKLNVVAEKIISMKTEFENVVVVVSAQGKTTDRLIKEAQELSAIPDEREIDMLLSTGEQVTASKLSILLNRKGHNSISLTGWQAGIVTNNVHKNAKITQICTERIEKELSQGKIVVVAGFQGLNESQDITTLGRGGSDTTAVALQAGLNADKCYIFSDVDGIYSADPNMVTVAKRLNEISFDEMQEISDAGAKVLHNRCVQIGKKFECDIVARSTFSDKGGTKICKSIETNEVKSIVKNDKLIDITISEAEDSLNVYQALLDRNIVVESFENNRKSGIEFRVNVTDQNKISEILERKNLNYVIKKIIKLTLVGYGITQDNVIISIVIDTLKKYNIEIFDINLTQSKIELIVNDIENSVLEELHNKLIKD